MSRAILVIEDEAVLAKNIQRYLTQRGYEVHVALDGAAGLRMFDSTKPDLVLLDYHLPDTNGVDVLRRIMAADPAIKVIMFTAHGSVQVAVEAMKSGAFDYLSKPLGLSELNLVIEKALGQERLEQRLGYFRAREVEVSGLDKILGASPAIAALKARITQLLASEARMAEGAGPPVLISGESGTGKELVARALHFDGKRRDGPFVEINCASIPAQLVESELFGHERGAFTDAKERKTGLIESADGGTLFLDEVGELDIAVQAKLLKLLEDRMVRRVGAVRDRQVDIRIVAATNRSLETLIRDGRFRLDLFARLRVVSLDAPPLRARGDDAAMLAQHFLAVMGARYGRPGLTLSTAARAALLRHSWPGNVRELRNVIEQAVLLAPGPTIEPDSLAFYSVKLHDALSDDGDPTTIPDMERTMILRALEQSRGNVTNAARALGISRDTMRYRMEKHQIR